MFVSYVNNLANNIEPEHGERFSYYYYNLLYDTYNAIGKKDYHLQSLARFNIIFQGKINDFNRAIEVTNNHSLRADISLALSYILSVLGMYSKALEYGTKSLDIQRAK